MLNREICKSDNWRCVVELSSGAGSGGSCTAPGPQHSMCCVMEMPAFNYGFKTLISVCVCVLQASPCACSTDDERCFSSCLPRRGIIQGVFISSWKAVACWVCQSERDCISDTCRQLVVHESAWGSVRVPGLSFLARPCSCVHFCRYCQKQMPWAPRKPWGFGHFQSTALMLTAVSKVVVRPPS